MRRGHQKGSVAQQQGSSSRLGQPRARVLRGQRPEAMEEGESSPAESDSSDQGEAIKQAQKMQTLTTFTPNAHRNQQNFSNMSVNWGLRCFRLAVLVTIILDECLASKLVPPNTHKRSRKAPSRALQRTWQTHICN